MEGVNNNDFKSFSENFFSKKPKSKKEVEHIPYEQRILEDKVEELETFLRNILIKTPATISKVTSESFDENEKKWYRVSMGSSSQLACFREDLLFKNKIDVLTPGMEVIVFGTEIVGIVPDILNEKKEKSIFTLINWNEIGGLKSQVNNIKEAVEMPINNADLVKEFGLQPVKGLLLYGPPGCGKTLIAKAIASTILKEINVDANAFVYIKGAELLNMYVGATEERILTIFKNCRNYTRKTGKRSIIFIDEAEALLPARGSRQSSDVDKTIVPTFLSELDGFEGDNPFLMLSTNLPESIDKAVIREGRIDLKIEIARPTQEDSIEIFEIHLKKIKLIGELKDISSQSAKYLFEKQKEISGAKIATCVKMATHHAISRFVNDKNSERGVTFADIQKAIDSIK